MNRETAIYRKENLRGIREEIAAEVFLWKSCRPFQETQM